MIVRIDKSFQKDVSKINDAKTKDAVIEAIKNIQIAENITSINKLKKLVGYKNMYRIRLGDFRIGLEYTEDNEIILIRFLHRKEIYKRWLNLFDSSRPSILKSSNHGSEKGWFLNTPSFFYIR